MASPQFDSRANVEAAAVSEVERAGRTTVREWLDDELLKVLADQPVKGRWLDVGCGAGDYRRMLADAGVLTSYLGIDISVAHESQWQEGEVEFRERNLDAAEVGEHFDSEFDAVISIMVFEHLRDDLAASKAIHAALRPGGLFLLSVPAVAGATVWSPRHGYRWYTRKRVRKLARESGFEVVELRSGGGAASWTFESVRMMVPWALSKVIVLAASALTGGDRNKARTRWPWVARTLPMIRHAHMSFAVGRKAHKCVVHASLRTDRLLPWPDLAYVAVLKKI